MKMDGWTPEMRYCVELCDILYVCLQVLQYDVKTGTWTQLAEKMKEARGYHAIVEANLAEVGCAAGGN